MAAKPSEQAAPAAKKSWLAVDGSQDNRQGADEDMLLSPNRCGVEFGDGCTLSESGESLSSNFLSSLSSNLTESEAGRGGVHAEGRPPLAESEGRREALVLAQVSCLVLQ